MAAHKRVPKYIGFRIYFIATLLYFMLVFPFLTLLTIRILPQMDEFKSIFLDSNDTIPTAQSITKDSIMAKTREFVDLMEEDSLAPSEFISAYSIQDSMLSSVISPPADTLQENVENQLASDDENIELKPTPALILALIITFLAGFLYNRRFKIYFKQLKRKKTINDKTRQFVQKNMYKAPLINAAIMAFAFVVSHLTRLYFIIFRPELLSRVENIGYSPRYLLISFLASVLTVLFVFFWWKHRVQTSYIDHVFDEEKLKRRVNRKMEGRIFNRMIMSSVMTTILPILIVLSYILTSLTHVDEIQNLDYSKGQIEILAGDYASVFLSETIGQIEQAFPTWMVYFDAISSSFMLMGIYSGIFISLIYIVFFTKWTTQAIVDPVRELLKNMNETRAGTLDNYSIVRTTDEIGALTEGYNDMTSRISQYVDDINKMTEAYARFVPKQFLEFLGKDKVTEIILGDQVQKEMTVLFSDIRSFTSLSEKMTPKQNFDFINAYLGQMEPVIRQNRGFIDKYIGDAIMALFSEQAEDAIAASVEMRKTLVDFNEIRKRTGLEPINNGIGIHTGNLMLGVIGGHGRMDGTVISDAVNLAARLEGLTKIYGSSIIISQYTKEKIKNIDNYQFRFIDRTRVKGKDKEVSILEVLNGDFDKTRELKLQTLDKFNEATHLYFNNNMNDALLLFKEIKKIHPDDIVTAMYISRCNERLLGS